MSSELPLSGIRVIEMSHMVMGPACGMILAQLGADVIKIEPPRGDKTRTLGGMGISFFPLFNRGKRSVVIDYKTPEGRDAVMALLGTADVFIENFKDDTIAATGFDSETLGKRFPQLVIGAHKGFLSGPYEHRPALDEVVQMMTGLAYMTGSREQPLRVGASMNDIMGGMFGVIGILAGLLQRGKTGQGHEIRVGLFENCLFAVAQHIVQFQITGQPVAPMPMRVHAWPVYDTFDTADGRRLFIAVTTDGNWNAFCKAFDLQELLDDPSLMTTTARIEARARTLPIIARSMARYSVEYLESHLDALSIPFSQINAPHEMLDNPHVLRPGGLVDMALPEGQTIRTPVLPMEFDGHGLLDGRKVPKLGEDTAEVLGALGYDARTIQAISGAQVEAAQ